MLVVGSLANGTDTPESAQPAATPAASTSVEVTTAPTKQTTKPRPSATKTAKPKPAPKPKPQPARTVSKREWAKIIKKPNSHKGERYIIYGQVTQFDSATGDDSFLADTAHRNTMSYGYFDGENTLLTGDAKQLDDLVEDDVFRASITVLGKMDYDTQIGGNTTVPLLKVNSIKVIS